MEVTVERSTHGYWIKYDAGARGIRQRFVLATPAELAEMDLIHLERTKRAFAQGTHEKSYYYRDENGTICIPPDPSLVPKHYHLEEINSLAQADKISKEMAQQHYERYQDNGAFTDMMERVLGNPRKHLIDRMQNPKSNYERDLCREMIKALDDGSLDLTRIESSAYFRWRES